MPGEAPPVPSVSASVTPGAAWSTMAAVRRAALAVLVLSACGAPPVFPGRLADVRFVAGVDRAPPELPPGWVWPFSEAAVARGLPRLTVYRPVHVPSAHGHCDPVEVAPSVWVTPSCGRLSRDAFGEKQAGVDPPRGRVPPEFDLRAAGLDGPMKDQQAAPVSWAFAFSTVMEIALARAGRSAVVSPLHLVAHDAWNAVTREGRSPVAAPEWAWPYDPHRACSFAPTGMTLGFGCEMAYGILRGDGATSGALVAERESADRAGVHRIAAIHPVAHDPDAIAVAIAQGKGVYAAFAINMTAWSERSLAPGALIRDWVPDVSGDHAVVLVGFAERGGKRWFHVHNSWGPGWADGGYAWVSATMVERHLSDAWTIRLGGVAQ